MTNPAEPQTAGPRFAVGTGGAGKFFSDSWNVIEIKVLQWVRGWYWYLMGALVFPVTMFYWSRALATDDPEAVRRIMTGAVVFGITLMTSNMTAQQLIQDRFQGRLQLMITMPMSKAAYALGVIVFSVAIASFTVALLMAFALIAGVDFVLGWSFFVIVAPTIFSLAGLTLFIASYAPSAEVGSLMANLLGIVFVMISPVFFPIERAPLFMQWLGVVSPFRYAADGIMKSFSGQSDIWVELLAVSAFALVTMALGIWRMRWRES